MSASRRSPVAVKVVLSAAVVATLTLLADIGTGWASDPAPAPSISSDRPDYAPGDTVVLTGEGWQPGEAVAILVEDDEGKSWSRDVSVSADGEGRVRDEFVLPEWFVAAYRVTATGEASGVATTTFTDGNVYVKNASTTPAGAAVTYQLERWTNDSNCPAEAPTESSTFTITGPEATSVSPAGANSVGANNKDSIRVTFSSASAGFGFEKWNVVNKDPSKNVGENGSLQTTSTSFCVNVSDSAIARSYVGFVKVTATPPTAKAGADQTADEAATVNLDGSGSTGATGYSWAQLSGPTVGLSGAATATPSFTAPDGPATLTFRLTASNGAGSSTDDIQVSVKNVAPTVTLSAGNTYTFPESTTAQRSFAYTATDPAGTADPLSISIDCGSGTYVAGSDNGSSFKCLFADDSSGSSVKVTASDGDGGSSSASKALTIENVAPSVEVSGPTEANEGQTKTYTYAITDPGADSPTVTESCGAAGTRTDTPAANSFDCTFPDGPDTSTVSVTADDGDDETSDQVEVEVANVAPTVELTGPTSADEGDTKTYTYAITDPGADSPTVTESCGTAGTRTDTAAADSFDCTFPDGPDTSTVSVTADDGDNEGEDSLEVEVANVAPTVELTGPTSADEGDTKTYTYSVTDPGADSPSVTESCGTAGTRTDTPAANSFDCTFPDGPDTSTVSVTADDGDNEGEDSLEVEVANVAPTVELTGPTSADEGDTKTYSYSVTDPGADSPSVTESCGTAGTRTDTPAANSFDCTFPDGPATSTVSVTADDSDDAGEDQVEVEVANVAPTVELSGPTSADEGQTKTYTYAVSDPGADSPSVTESCGAAGTRTDTPAAGSFDCTFPDGPDTSTVSVTADDGDEEGEDSLEVEVANVAPTVELSGPTSADEGQTKTYTYSVSDPGADSPTVTESCGAGTRTDTAAANSFDCTFPDGPDTSTVSVTADDGDDEGEDSLEVEVANVAPSGSAGGPYSGAWGDAISFAGSASDPAGSQDTLTFEWDFDYDGTFVTDATGASPSHTYSTPGTYTAALRVSDEDGGTDSIRTASVAVGKRATTLTYGGDTSKQYSDVAKLKATLLDGSTGVPGKTISFTIGSQSTTATTDADGVAETTLQITQANGSYTVATGFSGDALYVKSADSDAFAITQENAGATYTGDVFARTSSATSSTATVVLSATVKDITALVGDPAYDPDAGQITFAKVTFVDGAGKALSSGCTNLPVGLVSLADQKVGTATCNWSASVGNQDSVAFTVGIKVEGRYTRHESTDDTVVTVSKPLGTNFITGGGYLVNQASAGQKAGGLGAKTNFGFNVKYNKSGTNLQGNINAIVRNGGSVYQIKGNSMTSLYVAPSTAPSTSKPATATFNGKASIQDITDPLEAKPVDGNATLQVKMTDKGEPGAYDTIAITVWNKAGGLWFASRWDGTRTVEQLLGGGNLVVR